MWAVSAFSSGTGWLASRGGRGPAGCWHGFSAPAGPHQVRVLITGRPWFCEQAGDAGADS